MSNRSGVSFAIAGLVLLACRAVSWAGPSYTYGCPPGDATQRPDGVCIGKLQTLSESLTEPSLAVDPYDQDVLAVGTNASQNVGAIAADRLDQGARTQLLGVHVSENGGATWTRRQIPPIPFGSATESISQWDPSLAFGTDGTLHVSGIEIHGSFSLTGTTVGVFYTSSPDRGVTWTPPVILGSGDRQWLSVFPGGHVFVTWWTTTTPRSVQVAMSLDNGATWTTNGFSDCKFPSTIVGWNGGYYTACEAVNSSDASTGTRILAIDANTGRLSESAFLGLQGANPMLQPLQDGSLLLVTSRLSCVYGASKILTSGSSDGVSWSTPVDVLAQASIDESLVMSRLFWLSGDPWGTVELLIAGPRSQPGQPGAHNSDHACLAWFIASSYSDEIATAHLVLDPTGRTVVHSRLLSPAGLIGENRVPPAGYGLSRAGDFFSIAPRANDVLLMWEYERGLDFTALARS